MIVVDAIQPGERSVVLDCGHTARTWVVCDDGQRRVCVPCWKKCQAEPQD